MNQANADGQDDLFTTETAGLPEVPGPDVTRLARRRPARPAHRPGAQEHRRRRAAHARLQRLDPRPDPARRPGLGDHRAGARTTATSRRPCTGTACGWRTGTTGSRIETQAPIPIGGTYTLARSSSPTPGSTGTTRTSARTTDWRWACTARSSSSPPTRRTGPPADRQLTLTLDDLLVEDGHIAPFRRSGPTFTAMGRFGNVMLINGETRVLRPRRRSGEVVRLYVVNTANTRIFNFAVRGARAKLVGGDSGRYERETFVDEVLLAPSERAVLDVLFDTPGRGAAGAPHPRSRLRPRRVLGHRRRRTATAAGSFELLRTDPELTAEHQRDRPRPRTAARQGARVLLR